MLKSTSLSRGKRNEILQKENCSFPPEAGRKNKLSYEVENSFRQKDQIGGAAFSQRIDCATNQFPVRRRQSYLWNRYLCLKKTWLERQWGKCFRRLSFRIPFRKEDYQESSRSNFGYWNILFD